MSDVSLSHFAQDAYKDYALYVLHDRALPRLIDGLKPVQRRLVFAMHQLHLDYKSKPKKSARTVGDVLGKFHPHSDQACYEALVNLSQPFTTRYPLLDGQGNFGSQDDPKSFAAMRYTEVKLSLYANLLLDELNEDVVPWQNNFDGTLTEPQYLPAQVPFLLLNGCSGIAVGMSCEIPSFNLSEVIDALILFLTKPKSSALDLTEVLKGPDFPTGGVLKATEQQLADYYSSSTGSFILEGRYKQEGKKIVITQLPYTLSTSRLIEQIQQLAQKKHIVGLTDLLDLSDHLNPVSLECHFKTQADCLRGLAVLLSKTDLRRTYRSYFNILNQHNVPGGMSLISFLASWIEQRREIVLAQFQRRMRLITQRLHIINALACVYDDMEEVIRIIRFEDHPWQVIAKRFDLDQVQIDALRLLRLSQLTKLNAQGLHEEKKDLEEEKVQVFAVIQSPTKLKNTIKKQLLGIKKGYSDPRRTQIVTPDYEQVDSLAQVQNQEEVIKSTPIIVILTQMGWIKAIKCDDDLKEENIDVQEYTKNLRSSDKIRCLIVTNTKNKIALWDDQGRVYGLECHKIPTTRFGEHLNNFINAPSGHSITNLTPQALLLVLTSNHLTMKVDLSSIALTTRGTKVIDFDAGASLAHLKSISSPYLLVQAEKAIGVLNLDDIPLRKKGKGVLLVHRSTPAIKSLEAFYDTSKVILKKTRGKGLEKSFEDLLIKRSGKLKAVPATYASANINVIHRESGR